MLIIVQNNNNIEIKRSTAKPKNKNNVKLERRSLSLLFCSRFVCLCLWCLVFFYVA